MRPITKVLDSIRSSPVDSNELLITDSCLLNDDVLDDTITAMEKNEKSRKTTRREKFEQRSSLNREALRSMSTNIHTLTNIAAILSKTYKLNVQLNNSSRAFTSYDENLGVTINIPIILKDNEYIKLIYRGYIDHEAAHARFTDFKQLYKLNDITKKLRYAYHNVLGIANILEDVFVENKLSKYYSGCKENFYKLAKLLFLDMSASLNIINNRTELKESPMVYLFNYILLKLRGCYVPELLRNADAFAQVIPKALLDNIDTLLDKHVDCFSTEDNINLALAIYKEIDDYNKQLVSNYVRSSEESSSEESSSEESSSEESSSEDDLFNANNLDNSLSPKDSEHTSTIASALLDSGVLLASALETIGDSVVMPGHSIAAVKSMVAGDGSGFAHEVALTAMRKASTYSSESYSRRIVDSRGDYYNKFTSTGIDTKTLPYDVLVEASRMTDSLLARLKALLQAQDLRKTGIGYRGRLNTSKLYRVAFDNGKVFTTNRPDYSVNTEIVLCVDCSGSMSIRDKRKIASQVTFATIKALRTIKSVKSAVVAFNHEPRIILRTTDVLTAKFSLPAIGGTNIGNAIITARRLFTQDELSRKIIVVVSDGSCEVASITKSIADVYRRDGIEFIGLGIADDNIYGILELSECVVVKELQKFAPALIGLLQKKLLDRSQAA